MYACMCKQIDTDMSGDATHLGGEGKRLRVVTAAV